MKKPKISLHRRIIAEKKAKDLKKELGVLLFGTDIKKLMTVLMTERMKAEKKINNTEKVIKTQKQLEKARYSSFQSGLTVGYHNSLVDVVKMAKKYLPDIRDDEEFLKKMVKMKQEK